LHVPAVVQCIRRKDNESAGFVFNLVVFKKKLASISCIPYRIQEPKNCPNVFFIRVDMKFGFREARFCANMNSLDIWREDNANFLCKCSNSEDNAPKISTQKLNMNIAKCLNVKPWKADKGQAKSRFDTR